MKEPSYISYELKLHSATPYRRFILREEDHVSIRTQGYPLHHPFRRPAQTTRRRVSVDDVPVYNAPLHRQTERSQTLMHSSGGDTVSVRSPLRPQDPISPSPESEEVDTVTATATHSDTLSLPQVATPAHSPIQPLPQRRPLAFKRQERKIRGREEYIYWFSMAGETNLAEPPQLSGARCGDLFVYSSSEGFRSWIRKSEGSWEVINAGDVHPTLPGYRLRLLKTGDPRWVTRQTQTTYKSRRYQIAAAEEV